MAFEWGGSGTVTAGGANLEYACHGPAPDQAPTLVLLHEGLGCVALWRDFPEKLAAATGLGVFVYSRQGYGQSDPVTLPRPLDFMTREAKDVLPGLLDAIGLEHGVLMGHSDGATIAAIYGGSVLDHRVRGLILMAPHFFTEPGGLAEIAKAKEAYDSGDLKEKLAKYHKDPD
ncbi:MAG: alpha/beta fold hydrolase, partial [Pseudomonadota bacterium]|nr:alpha/beta fold hydrolase [Pseudomonadota bacterium]